VNNVVKLPVRQLIYVKVSRHSERLWIRVTGEDSSGGKIIGTVANDPLFWPEEYGDEVKVDKSEILEWSQQ
jgi:uncharacterized protein YegJ (DUF2314 family)